MLSRPVSDSREDRDERLPEWRQRVLDRYRHRRLDPARDEAIDAWCESVWNAFQGNRDVIVTLLAEYNIR